jgi:hypothetical protein
MDVEPLTYPVAGSTGRYAVPVLGGAVLGVGIGLRYAALFSPSVIGVAPALGAILAASLLAGYLTTVLTVPGPTPPDVSREQVRTGFRTLLLAGILFAVPLLLLLASLVNVLTLESDVGAGPLVLFVLGATAALAVVLAVAYLFPVVVIRAADRPIRAALSLDRLLPIARETGYLVWWALGFWLVAVGLGLLSVTISSGQIAGAVAAFLAAYTMLAGSRALRRGYESATE